MKLLMRNILFKVNQNGIPVIPMVNGDYCTDQAAVFTEETSFTPTNAKLHTVIPFTLTPIILPTLK
jgi:hypothetical protein